MPENRKPTRRGARNQVIYGAPPSVDLLPKEQRAELQHERTMPKLLLAIVGSAVVAGLIWAAGMLPGRLAEQRLSAAEVESQRLIAELEDLGEVNTSVRDLSALAAARIQATSDEVLFADVRNAVVAVLPDGAQLVSFSGVLVSAATEASESGGTSGAIDLGQLCTAETASLTLRVSIGSGGPAASFVEGLKEIEGYTCAVTTGFDGVEDPRLMTVQVALGPEALAGRFTEGGGQ